ncbi:MAG TPA: helix-turn-helix domain-containing protein [Gammaproteobacteria bacterium]
MARDDSDTPPGKRSARKAGRARAEPAAPQADPRGGDIDGAARFAALATQVRAAFAGGSGEAPVAPSALARAAGLGRGALTALLRTHAHMTPAAWLARERVRSAARRLLETRDSVADVAVAAGFAGEAELRRVFLALARLSPEDYRALARADAFVLRLPARYRAREVLAYHARDPESPCERVDGARVFKALAAPDGPAILEIELGARRAVCRVHSPRRLGPARMGRLHAIALRMLGLTADVAAFESLARRDPHLAPLVAKRRGLRLPLTPTVFDALCWAIIGQQINLAFASALRREMLALAGERIDGMIAHPTPARLADVDVSALAARRYSRSKAEYLLDTARAVAAGALDCEALAEGSAVTAEESLTKLRGIGIWTARYVLMRGAGFADCAPVGDVALAAALHKVTGSAARPGPSEVEALMRPFAPYRSLATFHLWASLREDAG